MNTILSAHPAFGDDHFIYRTPRWVEVMHSGLFLLIAGLLAYVALSISGISWSLTLLLWLATGISILIALRRRPEAASIYFACDHGGIYFPSFRAQPSIAQKKEVPWLHVPWHNVSDIRIQLLLDETANTKGVVFSIVANAAEEREFLARHRARIDRAAQKSSSERKVFVGFSNFFHSHDVVISNLGRLRAIAPAARVQSIDATLESHLAKNIESVA